MKRLLWLVAALVAVGVFPAAAGAKDVYGVTIAKDAHRKTIVAVTASGGVQTIRARRLGKLKLGNRFVATGRILADGTMSAKRLRPLGHAAKVRFRATVVKLDRRQGRLILSAGKSVFGLKLRSAKRAAASNGEGYQPGDKVECEASVGDRGLAAEEKHVTEVGHTDKLELEGIYLFANEGGISIAVLHRGLVHVQVPKGFELPELGAGDEVALLVSVEPNGSFTLLRLKNEDKAENAGKEPGQPAKDLYVTGVISQIRVDGLGVKPDGDKPAVNCKLPAGLSLSAFEVGDKVAMKCRLDGGHYVLVALKSDHASIPAPESSPDLSVTGVLAEKGSNFVRVQPNGDKPSVRCDFAEGVNLDAFAAGDRVGMYCYLHDGHYMLAKLKSDSAVLILDK